MGTINTRFLAGLVLSLVFSTTFAQNFIPRVEDAPNKFTDVKVSADGSLKMSGQLKPHFGDHKAKMITDIPRATVKEKCWFYGGDSLNGFDFESAYNQGLEEGNKMAREFRVFMFRAQTAFVKKKYGIQSFPFENPGAKYTPPGMAPAASCSNMDFESGSFTNWVGASGDNRNSNAFMNPRGTAYFNTNGNIYDCSDLQLISSAYGNDPAGGFPGLDPNGGNYSARLGGMYINEASGFDGGSCSSTGPRPWGMHWNDGSVATPWSNAEYIVQTFTVTAGNALVSFDYAVVLNDGGHPNGQQPYFHVYATNSSGTILNATCTEYSVQATSTVVPTGFTVSALQNPYDNSRIFYQGWKSGSMNLTPYIGQTVNLYFIAAGCTNGGHTAWAYVDAVCGQADIDVANTSPCSGTTTTFTAPPVYGGSYSWSGPGIVGSTTGQVITVNASGTYTCVVTPPQGAACSYTLTQSVTFVTSPTSAPSASPTSICSGASSVLTANATNATSYSWNPGGSTASTTTVTPAVGTNIYTLTVTNGGLCPVVKTVTVTVTATPTLNVTGTTAICSGSSTTLNGSGATTYSWQPFGSTSSSISVSPSSTTSYTLMGFNGTCSSNTVVTVNVTPTPTLTISGSTTLCTGQSTVLTGATATNYTWNPGGATTNTISVTPGVGTTNYTLTGANGTCVSTKTVAVTVTATPTLAVTGGSICSGQSIVLTNTGAGSGGNTYTWSPSGGNANSATVTPTSNTTYTLNAANGACTASITAAVNVTATPTLAVTGGSICSGQSIVLTNSGSSAGSYTWSPTGGSAGSATVSPTSNTTYTLAGANGTCTASTTAAVNVTATPTLAVTGGSICSGQSIVLSNTGSSAGSYTWSPTGGSASSATVSPTTNTTYTLAGANGTCTASTTAAVNVTTTPTLAVTGGSICSGQSIVLTNTGSSASSYTWSPTGGSASSATVSPGSNTTYTLTGGNGTCTASTTAAVNVTTTPTITVSGVTTLCSGQSTVLTAATASGYTWSTGATTNTISVTPPAGATVYTVTGANGTCTTVKTVTVNVTATPTVSITGAGPICSGSSITLNGGTATNYNWSPGGQTTGTITITPATGNNTYTLTGSNGTCTASAVATVSVTATPTMSITGASPICSGASVTLNGGTATNYTWSSGGNGSSTTVSPATTTTYTLTGANGTCTAQAVATINVTTTPTVSISGAGPICSGQNIVLTGGTATNYTWSPSGGSASTATVSPNATTTYTLTGANGTCTASAVATINVTTTPTVAITGAAAICNGGSLNLNGATATNYTWLPGGATTGTITVNPTSNTTYTLMGANGTCTASAVATVTVNPLPVIGSASITAAPCGQSTGCINNVVVSGGTPTYTYSWNGGAGSTSSQYCNHPAGTYVLVVTDANGCQATQNFSIPSQNGPTSPTLAATGTVACEGDNVVLGVNPITGGITYTWTDNTGTHTGTSYTITNIGPPGNYPISVTATDGSGCVSAATNLNITVNPLPNINASAAPNIICFGQNTVLNASGATSYTWSSGGSTSTETVSPTANTTYTVTGSTLGCVSTQTVDVTVTPLPSVTAVASPTTICAGQSTVLTAGGATTYTWSTGAPTQTVSVSPASNATYTVTGEANNCTATQTVAVNVTPLPVITASPAPPSICVGQNTTISAGGATSYTWSSNAGGGSATTVTVSPNVTTTYTLAGTQNGCTDSTTVTVSIGVPPTITVASSSTVMCSGGTTTLSCSGATNYTWMPGGATTGTITVSPTSNTVYTVSATSGGCPSTDTIAVQVTPTPTISANASAGNICSGQSTVLTASGSTSYTWTPGSATTNTVVVSPNVTTTYTVVSDSAGCTSQQQVTVNVTTTPTVTAVSSQTTICSSVQSATLTANGATSYTWSTGGTNSTEVVSPTTSTTYTLIGVNGNCSDTTTVAVNVTPTPTITIAATGTAVCSGQTATLTASGANSYTWQPINANGAVVTDVPASTTVYTVTGDNAGCTSTQQISVTVNPTPTIAVVSSQTVCSGAAVSGINYGAGSATVNWANTNINVGIGASGSGDIAGYTAPNVVSTEVGVITATPQDASTGCTGTSQIYSITINPTPQATGGAIDSALCGATNGGVTGITVSGGTPGYTYQWYNNGVIMPGDTNATLTNVGSGTYSVQITDANGCVVPASASTYTVNGSAPVVASITPPTTQGQAPLNVTFTNGTSGAVWYGWNFGNGQTSVSQTPGTMVYNTPGTYTVTMIAGNGSCKDTTYAVIIVDAATSIVIPNIYSPNGDGVNDEFMIICTGMRSLTCDIYNRWGQLVYTLNGPNDVWDGTLNNGNHASEGTYYYILNALGYDGKTYEAKGHLTLVK